MCRYNMTIRALLRSSPDVNINYIMINIISALPIWQKQLWRQNRTKATARIDFTIYYLATKTRLLKNTIYATSGSTSCYLDIYATIALTPSRKSIILWIRSRVRYCRRWKHFLGKH